MERLVRPEIKKFELNLIQTPTRDNDKTAIALARLTTKEGQVFEAINASSGEDGCCRNPACIIHNALLSAKGRVFHDALAFNNTPEALYEMYADSGIELVDHDDSPHMDEPEQ